MRTMFSTLWEVLTLIIRSTIGWASAVNRLGQSADHMARWCEVETEAVANQAHVRRHAELEDLRTQMRALGITEPEEGQVAA